MSVREDVGNYGHPGFDPVHDELSGVPLTIEGTLPPGLDGLFIRNGANALFPSPLRHMFDGEAMLHAIEIRGGEARYSNSLVRTPRTAYVEQLGRNPFLGSSDYFAGKGNRVVRLMIQRLKTKLGLLKRFGPLETTTASTSVLRHDDRIYCLQETGLPFALDVARDPDGWFATKGTGSLEDFNGALISPFSAHPKIDPLTGEVHALSQDVMTGTTRHVALATGGKARSAVIDRTRAPAMFLHDFIVTDHYIVFPDSSIRADPSGLAKSGESIARFDCERPLRFGLIARDHREGDPVRWFDTELPGHIWHVANAWEEEGSILLFAPVFRDYPGSVPIHSPAEPHAAFTTWRLDLATGEVREEKLLDHFYERPSIDPRRYGRSSRFAYLLDEERSGGVMGKGVLKYDLIDRREAGYVDYGELHGGEAVFVPRGEGEDEGWLLDLIADGTRAALIVVDAATMVECCRIHMPRRVPFGVHGLWLNRTEVDALIAAP